MLSTDKSINLFLLACIPIRILLSILPLYIDKKMLFYYGIVLLIISLSFLYLYFRNQRLHAAEAGGNTWWAKFRIIHGLLYLCGSIYALQGQKIAWIPLSIDTLLGMMLFINKHYI
jgi:hypothetical protein|tara:strand:- start:95 stop:442 length:348 start_codon:yes stop_codon:yes gene_type:complete